MGKEVCKACTGKEVCQSMHGKRSLPKNAREKKFAKACTGKEVCQSIHGKRSFSNHAREKKFAKTCTWKEVCQSIHGKRGFPKNAREKVCQSMHGSSHDYFLRNFSTKLLLIFCKSVYWGKFPMWDYFWWASFVQENITWQFSWTI